MYPDLSDRQSAVLDFIKSEIASKGYPPAVREICKAVGVSSTSTVHSHLNKLEKLGYIRRDPTKPRAILVTDKSKDKDEAIGLNQEIINLPLVGEITAGQPILAEQNIQEYIPLPSSFVKGKNTFMLKVKGESMINAGILDGDYVIIDKQETAENNQIIAALVDSDTATVKRFFKETDRIRLQPENEFMEPMYFELNQVKIIGVVIGVFRVYRNI